MENAGLLLIGLLVGGGVTYFLSQRKPATEEKPDNSMLLLQEQLGKLTERLDERLDKSQAAMSESSKHMLENIMKISNTSNQSIKEITESLTKLDQTNKQVINVTDQLQGLQDILKNPKQRGVLGEYYLETVLKNVLPPERYQMQYKLGPGDDGRELIVDAVVMLDKNKMVPIDSKFSLENYNRLIECHDDGLRDGLEKAFKRDLKARIDETAKYIGEGTLDYAFMFIPSEGVYYDLLINKVGVGNTTSRNLLEYAFQEKKVIIVSPTTLLAYLQTVLQGLRALQIEEQAKDIQVRVRQFGRHMAKHEEYMQKLGNSLGTTVNHFNHAHKELGKVDKDVIKIAGSEAAVEPVALERPQREE